MKIILDDDTLNPDIPGARIRIADLYTFDRIWSLEKVRSGYNGPCVRLQRGSDGARQDFGFTATGALDWAGILAWVNGGAAYVQTWYDQSEAACHVSQATFSAMPRLVNAGVADGGIWFEGDDILRAEMVGLYNAGRASAFAVVSGEAWLGSSQGAGTGSILGETNANAATGRYLPISRGASATESSRAAAYIITDAGNTVMQATKQGMFDLALHQLTATDTGSVFTFRGDGAGGAAVSYTRAPLTTTTTAIGGRVHNSGGINGFRGHIHEVLARTVVTNLDDVLVIEKNQRTRHGLAV